MAQRYYNGKKVIGIAPFSKKQNLKIYWMLGLAFLFLLYLIIRMAIWEDIYLTQATATPFFMGWAFIAFWTTLMYIKQKKKNYIFEEEK